VMAAGVVLSPALLMAQMDPQQLGQQPYPQSPQVMNLPANTQNGASTPTTGAQTTQTGSMRDSLGNPGVTGQQMLDTQFMRKAAQTGIADVKLGTLATQKGGSDVKELAQKLVDDHTQLNKELQALADEQSVMLPKKMAKEDQAEYDKLNGLSGKDFDNEYVTYIAKAHWQTVRAYYMEASAAADPDLQAMVMKSLGTMRQHGGLIMKTAKDAGLTLPPRPQRPAPTTATN